ncbi:MAG: hypothetical protein ACOCUT_00025 [bacterium]
MKKIGRNYRIEIGRNFLNIQQKFCCKIQLKAKMKKTAYKLSKALKFYACFGWKGIYSLFFPVYWKQDITFLNRGYDLLLIFRSNGSYFYGTYKQNLAFINGAKKNRNANK